MPSVERSLTIAVPPARVYDALVDHSRWLEWNPHMREMRPLSEGPLAPGFRARLAAKLNPFASTWEVTEVNPGRSFAWASSSFFPGLRLVFDHIAEGADGGTRATIRIDVEGPLAFPAWLAGGFYGRNFLGRSLGALRRMLEGEAPAVPEPEPAAEEPEPEAESEE
ncbi:MAG: SRPBCC family protein [Dehalococcoidia bacterium]|nr:SRPBCC family protein [Dehalococcoidia bacterium]